MVKSLGYSVSLTTPADCHPNWTISGAHRPVCLQHSSIRLQKLQNAYLKALKTNTCCTFEPVCRLHLWQRWHHNPWRLRKKHYSILNTELQIQILISKTRKQMYTVGSGQQSGSALIFKESVKTTQSAGSTELTALFMACVAPFPFSPSVKLSNDSPGPHGNWITNLQLDNCFSISLEYLLNS